LTDTTITDVNSKFIKKHGSENIVNFLEWALNKVYNRDRADPTHDSRKSWIWFSVGVTLVYN